MQKMHIMISVNLGSKNYLLIFNNIYIDVLVCICIYFVCICVYIFICICASKQGQSYLYFNEIMYGSITFLGKFKMKDVLSNLFIMIENDQIHGNLELCKIIKHVYLECNITNCYIDVYCHQCILEFYYFIFLAYLANFITS